MNKKITSILLSSMLLLAACGGGTGGAGVTTGTDSGTNPENESIDTDMVPLSQVERNIMDASYDAKNPEGYKVFAFKEGTGTCVDDGMMSEFSYKYSDDYGYHTVVDADGKLIGGALVTFTGFFKLSQPVILESGSVDCEASETFGKDEVVFTCKEDDVEVCTSTFKVFAGK